jgi:hypothetical protein
MGVKKKAESEEVKASTPEMIGIEFDFIDGVLNLRLAAQNLTLHNATRLTTSIKTLIENENAYITFHNPNSGFYVGGGSITTTSISGK